MKITQIDISRLEKKDRLNLDDKLTMNNLNNIVVLVGENGAGKTRLLQTILSIQEKHNEYRKKRENQSKEIKEHLNLSLMVKYDEETEKEIREMKDEMTWLGHLKIDDLEENKFPNIISFIPSTSKLKDWREYPKKTWMKKAEECEHLNVDVLADGTTAFIQKLSNQAREAESHVKINKNEDDLVKRYLRFCNLVETNLKLKLDRNIDGDAVLLDKDGNGNVIAEAKLSEGQQLLLQICVQLYAKDAQSNDYILLLDEPEAHLHPSAVIQFIEDVRSKNKNGQIWIATHSLALTSHFDPDDIWYVSGGNVERAGRKSEKILTGLIGNQEDIAKLRNFTDLPYQFGAITFSEQCLISPDVVENGKDDLQFKQIKEMLKRTKSSNEKLKLLDFGAGKGRLILAFAEDGCFSKDELDYHAFDGYSSNKEICIKNIKRFYGNEKDAEERYVNDSLSKLNNQIDIVLMCNVLHEIDYGDWEEVFNKISNVLKDDGYLLFVEDNIIPVGELPNKNGFLVLNTPQLETLFETKIPKENIMDYHDYNSYYKENRLMAHLIPVRNIKNISKQTIKNAIHSLKEMSEKKLKDFKEKAYNKSEKRSCKEGLEYGFWLNQYANASLCLNLQDKEKRN